MRWPSKSSVGRVIHCTALVLAASASAAALAIVAGAPPDSPVARVDPNTTTSPWRGVVSIDRQGNLYTGVIVGRRHVLTAAHVIDGSVPASGYHVQVNLSDAGPVVIGVVAVTVNPSFGGLGVHDLALLQLEQDAPAEAVAYPMAAANPPIGTTFTLVGYGDSGTGDVGLTVGRSATVKRVGRNAFDYTSDGYNYYFDFDGPTASTNYMGGTTLGNTVETTLAAGDSGGPAFAVIGGVETVVGINAFVAYFSGGPSTPGTFGTGGGGSLVAPHRAWIDATMAASGVEGSPNESDAPLPAWASAVLAPALLLLLWRTRQEPPSI